MEVLGFGLWALAAFIVAIGVLVSFHEYGHYWVARKCGIRVLRFSFGWGAPFWKKVDRHGTEWALAPFPIGGYVKFLDQREGPVPEALRHEAFDAQSVGKRAAVAAAGPVFNFALAFALFWLILVMGIEGRRPVLAEPQPETAAALAGLHSGDEVLALEGEPTPTWSVLRMGLVDRRLDQESVSLRVRRKDGEETDVALPLAAVRVDPEHLFDDLGLDPVWNEGKLMIVGVEPDTAAARSGVRAGDRLVAADGVELGNFDTWLRMVQARPGQAMDLTVERAGAKVELQALIGSRGDGPDRKGFFGASFSVEVPPQMWETLRAEQRLGPLDAIPAALAETWRTSWVTLRMLYRMVLGDISVKNISGPIQIAQVAGQAASVGLVYYLNVLALISVSLAVLNLLPVPVLDGGHLLYYAVEAVRGKPLSERAQGLGQWVGMVFVAMLIGLAFYNDIMRLVG